MSDNQQNTATGGAGPLVANTGNSILDGFFRLANVGVVSASNLANIYQTQKERETARKIALINATKAAQQDLPASNPLSPLTYLTEADGIQKTFFYAGVSIILVTGSYWLFKKVF